MKATHSLLIVIILLFTSCKKSEVNTQQGFYLDYNLIHSAPMKSTMGSPYDDFYAKYIATRLFTPAIYELTFKGEKGSVFVIKGNWKSKNFYTFPYDKYSVSGISYPFPTNSVNAQQYFSDTCFLNFSDSVEINNDTKYMNLKARYDCSLFAFDNQNIKSSKIIIMNPFYSSVVYADSLKRTEFFDYKFFNTNLFSQTYTTFVDIFRNTFPGSPQAQHTTVYLSGTNNIWKPGYYYYFQDINGGYELLPMIH